ncbi:MAG: hypothetical protein ABS76_35865 [Pelagibacterium sp. SCN 64-44]|nr:MAG: hypothetical protein ABS76_35865 [Pelagibacterium sp. SCN 64-44]
MDQGKMMAFESQAMGDAHIDVGAVLRAVLRSLPRILAITALLLAAAFVVLLFAPRLYESSASILVEPRSNVYLRAANEQAPSLSGAEAGVVSSQIELIKSRDTLRSVVDTLELRSVPEFNGSEGAGFSPLGLVMQLLGRGSSPVSVDEAVLRALYERLTVVQERDSRIISVLVRSSNPQLAADIANAIAEAHVARRAGLSLSDTAEASGWLAEEIAKLRVRVTDAETAVATFKVNNDLFSGANNTSLLDQQLSTIATQINAAQERKNTALSRATLIRDMIAKGQPIDGVADVRDSVVIQQLSQEKARLQGEKAQRSATLLANHPTIRALTAQIAELNNQINLEGRRVADALEAESRIEADLETSLQADLARAKTSASTATQDTVTLEGLQREAKAQRDLLESYLQRYSEATSRTDSNSTLPDVRVVTQAVPAASPASPKTTLVLLAVGLGALMVQLGLVVFGELISGRVIIAPPEAEPLRERPQDELDEPPFISDAAVAELEEERVEGEPAEAALEDVRDAVMAEMDAMRLQPAASAATRENIRELMKSLRQNRDSAPEPVLEAPPLTILTGEKLAADLVLGKTHLLLLAAHGTHADCEALAEELVHAAIGRGLSVALIDAGSGRVGTETGLTDLSADAASFGDVVHKSADNSFAEVVWGQGQSIAPSSSKPFTLVEALGDIYEVVVVMTGRVGRMSSLPVFKGLDGRLVLVAGNTDEPEAVSATRARLRDAGYADCDIVAAREYAAA